MKNEDVEQQSAQRWEKASQTDSGSYNIEQ